MEQDKAQSEPSEFSRVETLRKNGARLRLQALGLAALSAAEWGWAVVDIAGGHAVNGGIDVGIATLAAAFYHQWSNETERAFVMADHYERRDDDDATTQSPQGDS